MGIKVTGVNLSKLHTDPLAEYTLVGDASIKHNKGFTWACLILNQRGDGEVLYGLSTLAEDVNGGELLPYVMAMKHLVVRKPRRPKYKYRLLSITDSQSICEMHRSQAKSRQTVGMWEELDAYEDRYFDLYFEHAPRRSHPCLQLVDSICEKLKDNHHLIDAEVSKVINKYTTKLQED